MPVTVIKKPEWGLDYYYVQGYCTSAELVTAAEEGTQGPIERAVAIFDLLQGELDMTKEDMDKIITINRQLFQRGKILTHAAVLTKSRAMEIYIKAFELLSLSETTKLEAFSSLAKGLAWLGLAEHEQELQEILNGV